MEWDHCICKYSVSEHHRNPFIITPSSWVQRCLWREGYTKDLRLTLTAEWPDLTSWRGPGNQQCVSFRAATIDWRRRIYVGPSCQASGVVGTGYGFSRLLVRRAPFTLHRIQCDSSKGNKSVTVSSHHQTARCCLRPHWSSQVSQKAVVDTRVQHSQPTRNTNVLWKLISAGKQIHETEL